MNAKPETELNSSVFIQKWCNVNGALEAAAAGSYQCGNQT